MEKALESKCKKCKRIEEIMSQPDCIYMKGAKKSPDIVYICHACLGEKNRKFRQERFPEQHAEIERLKKEGKWFNITKEQNEPSKKWTGFFDQNHGSNPVNIPVLYDSVQKVVPLDKIDVLFVDAGFVNRAECIVYFCDRVKINNIIAHDTSARDAHQYNWPLTKAEFLPQKLK